MLICTNCKGNYISGEMFPLADAWFYPCPDCGAFWREDHLIRNNFRYRLVENPSAFSPKELAEEFGVAVSTIHRWKNGSVVPSEVAMREVIRFFVREKENDETLG